MTASKRPIVVALTVGVSLGSTVFAHAQGYPARIIKLPDMSE